MSYSETRETDFAQVGTGMYERVMSGNTSVADTELLTVNAGWQDSMTKVWVTYGGGEVRYSGDDALVAVAVAAEWDDGLTNVIDEIPFVWLQEDSVCSAPIFGDMGLCAALCGALTPGGVYEVLFGVSELTDESGGPVEMSGWDDDMVVDSHELLDQDYSMTQRADLNPDWLGAWDHNLMEVGA